MTGDVVQVFSSTEAEKIILVSQFRPPQGQFVIEVCCKNLFLLRTPKNFASSHATDSACKLRNSFSPDMCHGLTATNYSCLRC